MESKTEFIPPNPLKTAVLFLVFNRLDTTKQVFEAIKKAKPPRLYVAADGARETKEGEDKKVKEVRDYVIDHIDWECDVKTLFREQNLGCKYAVSGGIDWFFENEEMGIILEDDVVPVQSFFWFCESMLNYHKNDDRVMMISGTNYYLDIRDSINKDYFFSRHFTIWGWATWKRAWAKYDINMSSWNNGITASSLLYLNRNKYIIKHFVNTFKLIIENKMDTWDVQWVYTCLINYGLCLTASKNLISNVGVDGTHTTGKVTDSNFLETHEIDIENLKINNFVFPEESYDYNLHKLKNIPLQKKVTRIEILKILGIYKVLKKIYHLIKK